MLHEVFVCRDFEIALTRMHFIILQTGNAAKSTVTVKVTIAESTLQTLLGSLQGVSKKVNFLEEPNVDSKSGSFRPESPDRSRTEPKSMVRLKSHSTRALHTRVLSESLRAGGGAAPG